MMPLYTFKTQIIIKTKKNEAEYCSLICSFDYIAVTHWTEMIQPNNLPILKVKSGKDRGTYSFDSVSIPSKK